MRKRNSKKQSVEAPLLCDLTDDLGERFLHHLCIGTKRDILMLSTSRELSVRVGRSPGPKQFRVQQWHNGDLREFELPSTPQVYYFVQALGEDYLCVASRCAPEESNAHLFDAEGNSLASWHAGDGIEDVQIAPDGKVWVSYFDEGVFGDLPLGAQGLNCFDARGERLFGFRDDIVNLPDYAQGMADCYALNVASNRDTWLFYYTDFPLVQLREFRLKNVFAPTPEIAGSHAFAVCDSRRLFVGGYEHKNRLFWRDESSGRQVELEAVDEAGAPLRWNRIYGRGADLFLCDDARVRMLSLNEIGF